jgi:hypothetical protein
MLFNCPEKDIRHGIILKNSPVDNNEMKDKTILLSTEVECEKDIPQELINPIPNVFSVLHFSVFFNGMFFDKNAGNLVLLLNPEQIIQNIQKGIL